MSSKTLDLCKGGSKLFTIIQNYYKMIRVRYWKIMIPYGWILDLHNVHGVNGFGVLIKCG